MDTFPICLEFMFAGNHILTPIHFEPVLLYPVLLSEHGFCCNWEFVSVGAHANTLSVLLCEQMRHAGHLQMTINQLKRTNYLIVDLFLFRCYAKTLQPGQIINESI